MKKLNYLLKYSFLAIGLMIFTTSCSDDDESNQFEGPHFAAFLGQDSSVLVSESGDPVSLDLGITEPQGQDVTITVSLTEGTAVENTNFTISSTTVTIPAGQYNGSITISPIDDSSFNESRTFTLEITDVTSGNLRIGNFDEISYLRTVVLSNDDCPTQSNLWWGNLAVEDVGFDPLTGVGSANASGDCDVLLVEADLPNGGAGTGPFELFFTPSSPGATSGTVDVPAQTYCVACSAGLDAEYSATGTYDETTQTIILFYSLDRTDGANFWSGTNIITLP